MQGYIPLVLCWNTKAINTEILRKLLFQYILSNNFIQLQEGPLHTDTGRYRRPHIHLETEGKTHNLNLNITNPSPNPSSTKLTKT